jgi:hypothetical protein
VAASAATIATLVAAIAPATVVAAPEGPGRVGASASTHAPASAATVPDDIASRYLSRRPALGPVTLVDVAAESEDRRLLATTLQGVVNRSEVRIYLRGVRSAVEDQRWIDHYLAEDLIDVVDTIGLDDALDRFGSELAGYVVADPAEPWTINTATTVAGVEGAVVATPATVAAAQAAGLAEVDDHRGRWASAAAAYAAVLAAHRDDLAHPAAALQQADRHQPRDLYVQQGMVVMFTRPALADYDAVYDLIDTLPVRHPLYGYVSDTGVEEVQAVARLSMSGRFLIPTDTTSNLSFHHAVGGAERVQPAPPPTDVEPCDPAVANVVIAFSDGDNLVIPAAYYPRPDRWADPRRGELPVGWGITPAAAVLLPAMWDRYLTEATERDEIVDIMGLGYSIGTLMPNARGFLADGMRLRAALGVEAHWSLDALLSQPDADGWADVLAAHGDSGAPPGGMLLNYGRWPGPATFATDDGVPVLASRQESYDDGPAGLLRQIEELVAADPAERPLVNFFSATVWNASYADLVDALAGFSPDDVRFLTPSEAFACLPEARGPQPTSPAPPQEPTAPGPSPAPAAEAVAGRPRYAG